MVGNIAKKKPPSLNIRVENVKFFMQMVLEEIHYNQMD